MEIETTHHFATQQLHALNGVSDADLVLLLAGAIAARQLLLTKINLLLNNHEQNDFTRANFVYLQTKASEFDHFITQLRGQCNAGHRLEAQNLLNLP